MFAVKGWSIDAASLKAQTEIFQSSKSAGDDDDQKRGRKRKRGEAKPAQSEDVGQLWDQHIEGKEPVKAKKPRKRERKQKLQKTDAAEENSHGDSKNASDKLRDVRDVKPTERDTTAENKADRGNKKRKEEAKSDNTPAHRDKRSEASKAEADRATKSAPPPIPSLPQHAKLTPMQAAMRQKLVSARFRHLNQTLYTAPSDTALELFDQNPEMFEDYHAGFRQQVSVWPENPVDNFITTLRARGQVKPANFRDKKSKGGRGDVANDTAAKGLPRTHGTAIVADMGCGDARLAQTLKDAGDLAKLNLKIHSYDLHSPSPLVTKADISNVPLPDGSADVVIFCLALMGTNWISFIEEAYRILHWKGELWVAEIKSRFGRVGKAGKPVEHSVGNKKKQAALKKAQEAKKKDDEEVDEHALLRTQVDGVETKQEETDVSAFVDVLRRRGLILKDGERSIDLSNKMFVKMEFIKAAVPTKGNGAVEPAPQTGKKKFVSDDVEDVATDDEAKVLKPCLYKIR